MPTSMAKRQEYVRYPKLSYAVIQDGLARLLISKGVGRNGWGVMTCLCRCVYANGTFGPMGREAMCSVYGLTELQVKRGMQELREKEIITPVARKTRAGVLKADKSRFGHVAQYRFTKQAWNSIQKEVEDPKP